MRIGVPTVSVVVPVYGPAEYLLAAVESVLAQTFGDHEIILVDDGCPDGTAHVVRSLVEAGRLRYLQQTHRGPAAARNRGIQEAQGEFIAMLDDDDLWPPEKLQWQVEALRAHARTVLVYGYMETMGQEPWYRFPGPHAPSGNVGAAFLERNWIRSPGQTLIRAGALRELGGFDEQLWGTDDWDLYLRLAARGEFLYVPRAALHYRVHAGNASRDFLRMYRNACRVHRRHLGRWPRPGNYRAWVTCRRSIQTFCMNEFLAAVRPHIRSGRWARVTTLSLQALRIQPATVLAKGLRTLSASLRLGPRATPNTALADHAGDPGTSSQVGPVADPESWCAPDPVRRSNLSPNSPQRVGLSTVERSAGARVRRIQVQGPFSDSFSLASVNRHLVQALARRPDVEATLLPTDSPRSGHLVDKPEIDQLWRRSRTAASADCVIRNSYPPILSSPDPRQRTFAYLAWENSRIPLPWVDAFNRHFDGVMVPSAFVRSVLRGSGVAIPVGVVPCAPDPAFRSPHGLVPLDLGTRKSFRFLHVSSGIPRKGCDVLLRAYAAEFSSTDDVCLVIKTLPQYHNAVTRQIERVRRWTWRCPQIVHLDADLPLDTMVRLYRAASCLVHPARAEGFGLPVAEAMLARRPVIVTAYGGVTDFCGPDTAWLVNHRIVASASEHGIPGAQWAEPDPHNLRAQMRTVYEQRSAVSTGAKVERAFANISTNFTWDRAADQAIQFIASVEDSSTHPLRVGMVTTWNSRCGIAEYSRNLVAATRDSAMHWTLLAPHDHATVAPDTPDVSRCWAPPGQGGLAGLVAAVHRHDLDLVHFQFTFANFDPQELMHAIGMLKRCGRGVLMTCHALRATTPTGHEVSLRSIAAALSAVDRILVHTETDRRELISWGLRDNVTHLPHGFPAAAVGDAARIRHELGIDGSPVLATFGFLRPHKGTLQTIQALRLLKRLHPRAFLLAATALYPDATSQQYYDRCRRELAVLGLEDSCSLSTDFVDPARIREILSAAEVILLPYAEIADSVSGAVRAALAAGRPVLTTRRRVFEDVFNETFQLGGGTASDIRRGVSRILADPGLRQQLVHRARERATRDSWTVIGHVYGKILRAVDYEARSLSR
jgi:glycosyltransferase involved in cell wall biosynthesis